MYQPKMDPNQIRALFRMKEAYARPMTKILKQLLSNAFENIDPEKVCTVCRKDGNNSECSVCPFNKKQQNRRHQ